MPNAELAVRPTERQQSGADAGGIILPGTARSALLTLLSTLVYPDPEPAPSKAFVQVLGLCGFEERAVRQAINRAAASGWIESTRVGRQSLWHLTPAGHQLMDEGTVRLQAINDRVRSWDGRVVLLTASVPETERATRHVLKTRLAWAGFGSIGAGLWISTRSAAEREAAAVIAELGLTGSNSFVAQPGMIGDLETLIRRAWDVDAIAERYHAFVEEFRDMRPGPGDEMLLALLQLVHQRRRIPIFDPGLPAALLPTDWAGDVAERVWNSLHGLWFRRASARWREIRDSQ